jgi:excisionase family DNA binding protein
MVTSEKAVSVKEAARRLGVSETTIRRMIEGGEIRAFRVLGQWRIRENEIERIMSGSQDEYDQDRRDE